nr:FAD-dependent oxidoreductase [Luteimonas abyssi]
MEAPDDVLIVGGGVIGLASALALLETGRRVRVLEAGLAGRGSSHGNCGTITPSHAAPLTAPGTIRKVLGWMLTPDAPFYVKPRVDMAMWRWMLGFASHCNPRDWTRAMAARASILQSSRALLPDWIVRHGLECEYAEDGVDYIYRDPRELARFDAEIAGLRALGIAVETVDGPAYLRDEPALRDGIAGAVRFPGDARLRPDRYVAGLARAVRAAGGIVEEQAPVAAIASTRDGVEATTPRGRFAARDLVLASGAWSPRVGRALGLRIPVQPGKGYSITYRRPALVPKRPMVLKERAVCVTVWDSGFRLGSTMEFSGYDDSLNRRRLDALERGAAEYLREPVGPHKEEEWFGWRPLSVDDIPLIGRAPGHPHVWLATGHGMLGVSMSAATGRLVAELVTGVEPHLDPAPFDPARFG